jgi:hypothetical protein
MTVGVNLTSSDYAFFNGIESCGSIWACPSCAAKKRSSRAEELRTAYQAIQDDPTLNPGLFMTFTIRHNKTIPLKTLMTTIQNAYAQMRSSRAWRELMDRIGHVGIIRATEITYSFKNGWHPHFHRWLITESRDSNKALQAADAEITELWTKAVAKASNDKAMIPNRERGCHLTRVTSNGVAGYIAKTQDHKTSSRTSIAYEMMRADLKETRSTDNIMPFQMLDMDENMAPKWCEYVTATKGHRASAWSRGPKDRLNIITSARRAKKKANPGSVEETALVYVIAPKDYDKMTPTIREQVLAETEADPYLAAHNYGTPLSQIIGTGIPGRMQPGWTYEYDWDAPQATSTCTVFKPLCSNYVA